MKDGKVVLKITKYTIEKGNVGGAFDYEWAEQDPQELAKALILFGIDNPKMGEVFKFVANALRKRETPLIAPVYQA